MKEEPDSLAEALKYTQIGGMLVAPILGFGAIGYYLDRRLSTSPWLLLGGLILGMIGGFASFIRLVLPPKGGGTGTGGEPR